MHAVVDEFEFMLYMTVMNIALAVAGLLPSDMNDTAEGVQ
jgi:hypothetical protein